MTDGYIRILAIDPGRSKCGIAVVSREEGIVARQTVPVDQTTPVVKGLMSQFDPKAVVIGSGTGSEPIVHDIESIFNPVYIIDENLSSQKARERYFIDHPPKGWRRLLPKGLLTPPEPYDDYAAVILAELFLQSQS